MASPPTLCLNMIVKDESHIIKKTLTNLCDKFKFDYWVISDTGSSDLTIEIIESFFKEKNIPGEIHHDKWLNFAHNRNLALTYAFEKTDLLLIFDADDEIVGTPIIYYSPQIHGYKMIFKSSNNIQYHRICLINNKKVWRYKSVLHEYIYCTEPNQQITSLTGNYWLVSGRSGSRNKDPNKYLKDALLLETAYHDEKKSNGELIGRYAFYCAQSYRDAGDISKSIEWYKKNLKEEKSGWIQEKYISCLELYRQLSKINQQDEGIGYLIESYKYDKERAECIYELVKHYCCREMNDIAMTFFKLINSELQINKSDRLFIEENIYTFYLPYYMIIVADRLKNRQLGIQMYKKIFTSKPDVFAEWWLGNLFFNFQFFINDILPNEKFNISTLANEYICFLSTNNVQLNKFEVLKKYTDIMLIDYIFPEINRDTRQSCANSKNILIYTGFSNEPWNYTFSQNNALGGSEKAVAYLTKYFPKSYNIYISGGVQEEKIDNITWVPLDKLRDLVKKEIFNTVIISRYVAFYEMFPETKFYQSYVWAHDIYLLPYGCSLSSEDIILKHNNKIDRCICLTEFHKGEFIKKYPILKEKIQLINNGIICENFDFSLNKIKNRFIYSSCVERGLEIIIKLWPDLIKQIPDATLVISTYNKFPKENNDFEAKLWEEICKYPSITFLGRLSTSELYRHMGYSEFWLYPCTFPETSCITALEILMSGVIPVYYPYAALPYTLSTNGIQTSPGNEITDILKLNQDEEKKKMLVKSGIEYAQTCSWNSRAKEWEKMMFREKYEKNIAIFNGFNFHYEMFGYIINYCKKNDYILTIFTSTINNLGWLDFYKKKFNDYNFEYKNIDKYEIFKETFDITFVTTDDDYAFKNEWINNKCITIDHTNLNRRPEFKHHIGTREFVNKNNIWALPCYSIFKQNDKLNMLETDINIAIIGGGGYILNHNIINRLYTNESNLNINLNIIGRYIDTNIKSNINSNVNITIYSNMDTKSIFNLLKKCDYILTDITSYIDHINGISMSGTIPLAFSTLTPLIISKTNNSFYKFKNVIEFDLDSTDKIIVRKEKIDVNLLAKERDNLEEMFDNNISKIFNKNTALIVDPRDDDILIPLILDYKRKLGDDWIIVFYCGKGLKNKMSKQLVDHNIEIIELDVTNFNINEYSDFMKTKNLWNSLYGKFVLTFQTDAFILNKLPYDINYFINMNKSYIGGNMDHNWNELIRENLHINYRNFNGGLSLRKRLDMIKIIDYFGTEKTEYHSKKMHTDPEDVYFTLGCYKLQLPVGDNEKCQHFSINRIYFDKFFGVHKPIPILLKKHNDIQNIYDTNQNKFILVNTNNLEQMYTYNKKIVDCFIFYNELEMLTYRLNILYNIVDYFVIVEARHTFVGSLKKLYFDENKHLFQKFSNKIIYIVIDLPFTKDNINISNGDQWTNERYQRNCISKGLEKIDIELSLEDVIIIADLDEIPDPDMLNRIKTEKLKINNGICRLEQDFYYYNLNSKRNEKWYHCKILTVKKYKELGLTCDAIRFLNCDTIVKAGWHLSYFGNTTFIKNKLENFAHQEYNSVKYTDTDTNEIEKKIQTCSDLFDRDKNINSMTQVEIYENDYLPLLYNIYLKSFYKKENNNENNN